MASNISAPLLTTRSQQLFPAVVSVLLLALVSAVADLAVSALGLQTSGVQYRFQVIGQFLALVPQTSVLLALIAGIAMLAGHRVAVRVAGFVALALAVLALVSTIPFGLDFLQSRRLVADAQLRGFTLAGEKTVGFAAWFGLLLLWGGWRAVQASVKPDASQVRARGEGLVVGQ
jgi:ABC-type uncharacterized transport system permease subunit